MTFALLIHLKLLTIANSFWPIIAEHENFLTNVYENVIFFLAFSYLLAEKIVLR